MKKKTMIAALCAILILWASIGLPGAHASDPSLGDLSGTDSSDWADSIESIGLRHDIAGKTGSNGLQAGDDADSLAFGIRLEKIREHIWISYNVGDTVHKLKKSDPGGTPILSWGTTGYNYPFGCEYRLEGGNEYIYIIDYRGNQQDNLIKFHANNGTKVTSWTLHNDIDNGVGLSWNGSRWFIADFRDNLIYQVDPSNPTTYERSFSYSGQNTCEGLAWDGSYLWAVQSATPLKVFQIDIYGNIHKSWDLSPGTSTPRGIAYDTTSGHLWIVAEPTDRVYEYDTNGNQLGSWTPQGVMPEGAAYSSSGFTVGGMQAGDKYETYFTIGSKDFAMFFVATGPSAGILKLYSKVGGTWTEADTHTQSSIVSGTRFQSGNGNIAAKLTNSNPNDYGVVKLEVKKSHLTELGATGSSVTNIASYTYSGSSTTPTGPGADEGTKRDRCPSGSSYASYNMSTVPEFPLGAVVLAIPAVILYLYLRRHSRAGVRSYVRGRHKAPKES